VAAQRRHQVTDIEPAPAPKVTEYLAQARSVNPPGTWLRSIRAVVSMLPPD
jgi:hypothetical protein